jgi:dTDP-4-dehydrorhamnose 3,5-epimerase
VYNPTGEHGVHPLDPELALPWAEHLGVGVEPLLSPKDAAAPTLAEALAAEALPTMAHVAGMHSAQVPA